MFPVTLLHCVLNVCKQQIPCYWWPIPNPSAHERLLTGHVLHRGGGDSRILFFFYYCASLALFNDFKCSAIDTIYRDVCSTGLMMVMPNGLGRVLHTYYTGELVAPWSIRKVSVVVVGVKCTKRWTDNNLYQLGLCLTASHTQCGGRRINSRVSYWLLLNTSHNGSNEWKGVCNQRRLRSSSDWGCNGDSLSRWMEEPLYSNESSRSTCLHIIRSKLMKKFPVLTENDSTAGTTYSSRGRNYRIHLNWNWSESVPSGAIRRSYSAKHLSG